MSTCIRPGPREVMELQRRCHEECQPYINMMVREASMDTRMAWIIRKDGTLDRVEQEETATMKHLRILCEAIVEKYTRLANGEQPANTACKTTSV